MDVIVSNNDGKALLYRNDQQTGHNRFSLKLFDPILNRIAVGAWIVITADKTHMICEAMPGYSY